ncbi:hypothetical protein EPA93_46035 [Ktedonosporobacter rubrisoli]|uniref:Uncharacterized protein n=1 Tax=Ktedonosporobacter rubrisoli TaxID=2509675 RepID=A0A4P6K4F9_KTERU|nr:hypothetical protein [Ktedonosporobacter rubrisoli]QBD82935.1 hypothetical protein EPA93_46035 [Ktedonosporobacter rubrisoli]
MREIPPSKGVKLVESTKMLNFIHWLETYYPDVRTLRDINHNLLKLLVAEFEQEREDFDHDSYESWQKSVQEMLQGNKLYQAAKVRMEE